MNGNGNGSFPHLINQLDARLARIEQALDRLSDHHEARQSHIDARLATLEKNSSEMRGGWKMLTVIGTVAGAVGGYLGKFLN